jgi:hypothetical protein
MGFFGNLIGQGLGGLAGGAIGHQKEGAAIGGTLGGMLPFKKGGKVPGPRGKAVKAVVHGGEFVLPAGVAPTKSQKAKVRRMGGMV